MRKEGAWWRMAAIITLLTACGPSANPTAHTSTSSSARTTATATPPVAGATSCSSAGRNLALVTLRGSNQIVARDITDISHPKTVGTLGAYPTPSGASQAMEGSLGQLLCGPELSYLGGQHDDSFGLPATLFRAPLSGSPAATVLKSGEAVMVFAWSPDGRTVVYLTAGTLHELTAGQDRVLASVPPPGLAGGCEVAPCPGPFQNPGDSWDFRLAYSPDGAYVSMMQSSITSYSRIWTSDGRLLSSTDSEVTTMSVWSGSSLYFRDATGVEVWRAGAASTFLRGVFWIRPKASPDGRYIVYEARQLGSAWVFVVDTTSGKVRSIAQARSEPVFLTSRYIWYQAEDPCVAQGKCQAGFPGIASGKTYIYDLQDGTETESVITSVLDVWPHAA